MQVGQYQNAGKWFISPWNYDTTVRGNLSFQKEILLHDQTLRDGVQFSGIEFSDDEKVEIAARLDAIGVRRIEAGRISTDPAHLNVVKRICSARRNARIMGFVELSTDLIHRAADCGVDGVVLCFPSNEKVITEKMGSSVQEVARLAKQMVETANRLNLKTILFPTDAGRADPKHYASMIGEIMQSGRVDALTLVDTVGGCAPFAIPYIMAFLRTITDKPIEVHFHNDFGLAAANTLMALAHGASVAHTTILGVGERAGNAAFEEVALGLRILAGYDMGIALERLCDLSSYIAKAAALPITPNRPIVGAKIFEIECLENLLGYYKVPEETAVKYTFPFKWDVVGHPPMDFAVGAETTPELFQIILNVLGKKEISDAGQKKLLAEIHRTAIAEKRSIPRTELLTLLAHYQ
jgi:isopropylmalate/homocitrate/citramalate synthase